MTQRSSVLQSRSSIELRTQALTQMLGDLSVLERSIHEAVLPEFVSVNKPKENVSAADPLLFEDEKVAQPVAERTRSREGRWSRGLKRSCTPSNRRSAEALPSFLSKPTFTTPLVRRAKSVRKRTTPYESDLKRKASAPIDESRLAYNHYRLQELAAEQQRLLLTKILQKTESLEKYKPNKHLQQLKAKAVQYEFRANVIRLTKQEIYNTRQRKHLIDFQDKQRRFDWRQRADDIIEGKKKWAGLITSISMVRVLSEKQRIRKDLHDRSAHVLKFLLMMAMTVGKIAHTVKQRRFHRALRSLGKIVPYVRRWKVYYLKKMRERVTEFIENSLSMDVFYKIIVSWKSKVVSIQRLVKSWLLRRHARKLLQLHLWTRLEKSLSQKSGKLLEPPPLPVKLLLISELLKTKMKAHLIDLENWRARCEEVMERHQKLRFKLLEKPKTPPRMPVKPRLALFLSQEEVLSLMQLADKKKSRWSRMVKDSRKSPLRKDTSLESM